MTAEWLRFSVMLGLIAVVALVLIGLIVVVWHLETDYERRLRGRS